MHKQLLTDLNTWALCRRKRGLTTNILDRAICVVDEAERKALPGLCISAEGFVAGLRVNADNPALSDADFRMYIRNTLPIVWSCDTPTPSA